MADHYRRGLSAMHDRGLQYDGAPIRHLGLPHAQATALVRVEAILRGESKLTPAQAIDRAAESIEREAAELSSEIDAGLAAGRFTSESVADEQKIIDDAPREIAAVRSLDPSKMHYEPVGQTFEVDVPDDVELLDYDQPISEQSPKVLAALKKAFADLRVEPVNPDLFWRQTGAQAYRLIARGMPGGMQDASEWLRDLGVPGLRYLDGVSRGQGEGSHNYVIWDDSRVEVTRTFFQEDAPKPQTDSPAFENILHQDESASIPRGFVGLGKDWGARQKVFKIVLTQHHNLSTFLHESGHVFLRLLGEVAQRPDAPEDVKKDWQTVLDYIGAASPQDALETKGQEKFARAFESYLMEGKSPSARLVRAFERFRMWLVRIYEGVALEELTPEIRGVFNRMLATDAEIDAMQKAAGATAKQAADAFGIPPEEMEAYLEEHAKAVSSARRAGDLRVMAERLREQDAGWKEELAAVRAQLDEEYEQIPARQAEVFLRGKFLDDEGMVRPGAEPTRLDRAFVERVLGAEGAKRVPTARKGGVDPDSICEMWGFTTGAAMLEAIAALPPKQQWVGETADARMAEEYGDLMREREKLREVVAKGLHSDDNTAKSLLREIAALTRKSVGVFNPEANKTQQVPMQRLGMTPPVEAYERAADIIASKKTLRRLEPGRILTAERNAAQKALKAAATQNYASALDYKKQQLLNSLLYRRLTQALDRREELLDLSKKLAKDDARARLGKAAPVYRDAVDLILEQLGLKAPAQRDAPLPSLNELVAQMEADGATVLFDVEALGRLLSTQGPARKNEGGLWKDMTVGDLDVVLDALKNIRRAARNKTDVLVDGKRQAKEKVIEALLADAIRSLPSKGPIASSKSAESMWRRTKGKFAEWDSELLRPENMADWLSGGDLSSMWHRAIIQPLQDAKAKEVDILQRVVKPIIDAFEKMPKETRARFFEKVDGRKLFPTHRTDVEAPTRRFELLMMALNAGNASNLERLLDGRGIDMAQLKGALDTLSKEEMDWVQSIWDAADSLWPEARALEERDSGLAPARIPAQALVTKHGTFRGGYFPAIYDRRGDATGERQVGEQLASLMDPTFTRPGTPHSHLKKRASHFNGLISLEPANILGHFAQVAHDLAFREPLKSVGALILSPEIQSVLKDRLGDDRAQTFLRWLKDVGSMRAAQQAQHAKGFAKLLRAVRSNTIISILGYSIPTALGDLSNLAAAVPGSDLKAKHFGSALLYSAAHPVEAAALATSKSGEMRTRREQLSRELTKQVRSLTARGPFATGPLAWFKDHAFAFFEWTDILTSTPVWIGSYRQALDEGKNDADAVRFADATIRKLFPSHSAVDTAEVLRDKGFVGSSLMFYGFFNVAYNRFRDIGHQMWKAEGVVSTGREMGRLLAYHVAITALSELLSGRGKEDDEEWWEWFLRKLLVGSAQTVPLLGDIATLIEGQAMGKHTNPRAAPLAEMAVSAGKAIMAIANDDAQAEKKVKAAMRSLGPMFGVPFAQPIRSGDYVRQVLQDEAEVRNPADMVGGLIYGQRAQQPTNLPRMVGDVLE